MFCGIADRRCCAKKNWVCPMKLSGANQTREHMSHMRSKHAAVGVKGSADDGLIKRFGHRSFPSSRRSSTATNRRFATGSRKLT